MGGSSIAAELMGWCAGQQSCIYTESLSRWAVKYFNRDHGLTGLAGSQVLLQRAWAGRQSVESR